MNRYAEAEPLLKRALTIFEKQLGPDNPDVAMILGNLAELYRAMQRLDDAAILGQRLAAIPQPGTRELTAYFVTNRTATDEKALSFGSGRSMTLNFGKGRIALSSEELKRLAKRRVEGLGRLHRARRRLTSVEELRVRSTTRLNTSNDLISAAAATMQRSSLYKNQVLIFVHGYNVGFEDALLRAAQMAFDLEFDGALMPFTWPSAGSFLGYGRDRDSADSAVEHLASLLEDIAKQLPSTKVHLIAHSMGNFVVLRALDKIKDRSAAGPKMNIGEVILAHPDEDRHRFEELTNAIKPLGVGLTLYVNTNDWALWVSKLLRGEARAGGEVLVVPGVDTIDTSGMGEPWSWRSLNPFNWGFNHDVFVRDPIVFGEITRLLLTSQRPVHERTSEFQPEKDARDHTYWKFKPAPLASGS